MSSAPRVAVVVLTWNGREDTLACLASVLALDWPALDVIVADNGSADGTVAAIAQHHPSVRVVQNGANLGFAEGNNRGIAAALEAGADHVLVLNNDTLVPAGLLRALVACAGPGVGAVCPVIRFQEGEGIWFAGSRYDPTALRAGRPSRWERGAPLPEAAVEIDRAVGAAMLVPRGVIEAVGAFDAELFYLMEDVEWSLRMRRSGLRVLLEPRATVRHRVAASQGGHSRTPLTLYYGTRNDLEVRRRFAGASVHRELACVALHALAALRAPRPVACVRAAGAGWRDYRRGRLGEATRIVR